MAKSNQKNQKNKDVEEQDDETQIAGVGHNSRKAGGIAADQLKSIIERIERLEEEKAGVAQDIKDIFAEAKGNGYDVKTLRKIIALRKKDAAEREEEEYLLDTYRRALGMLPEFEPGDEA